MQDVDFIGNSFHRRVKKGKAGGRNSLFRARNGICGTRRPRPRRGAGGTPRPGRARLSTTQCCAGWSIGYPSGRFASLPWGHAPYPVKVMVLPRSWPSGARWPQRWPGCAQAGDPWRTPMAVRRRPDAGMPAATRQPLQIGIEGLYQPCNRRAHGAPPAPFVASGSCWPNPGSALPPEPGFAFGFFPFVDRLFLGSGELSGFLR